MMSIMSPVRRRNACSWPSTWLVWHPWSQPTAGGKYLQINLLLLTCTASLGLPRLCERRTCTDLSLAIIPYTTPWNHYVHSTYIVLNISNPEMLYSLCEDVCRLYANGKPFYTKTNVRRFVCPWGVLEPLPVDTEG